MPRRTLLDGLGLSVRGPLCVPGVGRGMDDEQFVAVAVEVVSDLGECVRSGSGMSWVSGTSPTLLCWVGSGSVFDRTVFRDLAVYTHGFEKEHGAVRVDIVLISGGILRDVVHIDHSAEWWWGIIEFGDGQARFVRLDQISQFVVTRDHAKKTPGFTVSDPG